MKRKKDRILQLSNDIAENMSLKRYSRQDLVDAITYWQDEACKAAQHRVALESTVTIRLCELVLQIQNKEI